MLVLKLTSGAETEVHVYGGSSDIFTYVRADSVVVLNDQGLKVGVYNADVDGSVYGYLIQHQVHRVLVDSVVVNTPVSSGEPPTDSTLTPIFTGTMAGMVTRADTVRVTYGKVVDPTGLVLVDSMTLNAAILNIEDIELDVRRASSFIPLFGPVEASGILRVDSNRVTLEAFQTTSPPGSLEVDGYLNSDSTLQFTLNGQISSTFIPEAPFMTAVINGSGNGSIMKPVVNIVISEGCFNYEGLMVGLTADSIISTRENCSVNGFQAITGGLQVNISGELNYLDLAWNGAVIASLQNIDISNYFSDLPSTNISSTLSASGSGIADYFSHGSLLCNIGYSEVGDYSVSQLTLDCTVNRSELSGSIRGEFEGGVISSVFSSSLGLDFAPVAWSAEANLSVSDCGLFAPFVSPALEGASGLYADISGEGNFSGFSASGDIELSSFVTEVFSINNVGFNGSLNINSSEQQITGNLSVDSVIFLDPINAGFSGISLDVDIAGSPDDMNLNGDVLVTTAYYQDITSDSILFNGDVSLNDGKVSGGGALSANSIILGGLPYSLAAFFHAEPGIIYLDTLSVGAPGNLVLDLSGRFLHTADSLQFNMDGIALTKAGKLRLISEGDFEFVSDSTGINLDTLWLDLPSGEISADGWMRGDSINASVSLSGVDIASFSSILGLESPLSGILNVDFSSQGTVSNLYTVLAADIQHPTFADWDKSDSLSIDIHMIEDSLVVDGMWTWTAGVRSGVRMAFDRIWDSNRKLDIGLSNLTWLETELTGIGDELFYLLPIPLKTNGASVSARVEYQRDSAEFSAGIASQFERLYLTNPGIEFPGVTAYLTYPDQQAGSDYNGRFTATSTDGRDVTLNASLLLDVEENLSFDEGTFPLILNGYSLEVDFNEWETILAGVGWFKLSGSVQTESDNIDEKPKLVGKLTVDQATISMGGGGVIEGSGSSSSEPAELPLDISLRISGERGIWFRTSYANVELSAAVDITTSRGQLLVGGDVKAVRGGVYLLGREFQITQGDIRILQTTPLGVELNIQADARIRSSVSGAEYTITVTVTGNPEEPDIALGGIGPNGSIDDQDIVSLLTAGMTYGELQQFDSSALGNVAGNVLGQWLASSIRDDMGLDALQFSPDFSSDSTSLVVNAGKYVLPDLFLSYTSDVFSTDAGTVRAQYFFNRDFFLEGSTKSTLTGNQDPSLELHYTFRY